MKQNIKRIWLALCMAVCLFALSACSSAEADTAEEMDPSLVMTLQQGTQQYLDLFAAMGDEDLDNALAASEKNKDTVMQSALNSWKSVKGDLGALVSSEAAEVGIVDDGYVARIPAVFEKRNAEFTVIVDEDLANITSITISPEYTTGEKLSKAGMNTLMGMGIVFLVLIFISWLISMFKYISVFEAKMKQKKDPAPAPAKAPAPAPAAAPAPAPAPAAAPAEEACDDTELVSVIAAAIAASEGRESADGLIVRSIKRVPNRNWK